jgi:dimethylamine monooxygenase subunit A
MDSLPARYLPFLAGGYSTAPGLTVLANARTAFDRQIFQADEHYARYIQNVEACRREGIQKYHLTERLPQECLQAVNKFLAGKMCEELPDIFTLKELNGSFLLENHKTQERVSWRDDWMRVDPSPYISLFDALASQVQEDLAICTVEEQGDFLAAVHVCAPNHWSPETKIGKPFSSVHEEVPGMEKLMPNVPRMLQAIVDKGPFTRFAWGISTDDRLNHHPVAPEGWDSESWQGRKMMEDVPLFVRTERQNLVGFPGHSSFLFTIRTYFYPVETLSIAEREALYQSVMGMSPEAKRYKGLTGTGSVLRHRLLGIS